MRMLNARLVLLSAFLSCVGCLMLSPGQVALGQPPIMAQDSPGSMVFHGPAPMGCDESHCDSYGPGGGPLFGDGWRGGRSTSARVCYDGACGPNGDCRGSSCGGSCWLRGGLAGCLSGAGGCLGCQSGQGSLLPGTFVSRVLGPLAPYSDGVGSQRWFDIYAGTLAMARKSGFGPFSSPVQDLAQTEPVFETTDLISTIGTGPNTPALRSTDLDLDQLRYGLELVGNILTGPGTNFEVRYFGLNDWSDSRSVRRANPDLFSVFSEYGTNPGGIDPGFDDTDRSFIHTISYDSKFDNGEVNYCRHWMAENSTFQGTWLCGLRYFELDEQFGFAAVGSNDNTFTFDQLRFFNMDTKTRNQLFGFQVGANLWVNLIPGIALGNEVKAGVYNNNAKVDTLVVANSVPGATEVVRRDAAAFLIEYSASAVYRLTYSWSVRAAYNLMYVDQVALAPENFNSRDMANAISNSVFGINRFPFINNDAHAFYSGYSIGAEYLW